MLAGKNSFGKKGLKTIATIRAALVAAAVTAALAGAPNRAWAICGMPSGLAGALQMSDSNAAVVPRATQLREMPHGPNEPIVGMWMISATNATTGAPFDLIFSGWTGDGLEFDQDLSPILTGYVCYGTWVKVGRNTYGLTHPFFNFMDVNANGEGSEATEGTFDGTSGYFNYTVTVAKDGKTFTGKESFVVVSGLNPYDPTATVLFTLSVNLTATKISVNLSQLP